MIADGGTLSQPGRRWSLRGSNRPMTRAMLYVRCLVCSICKRFASGPGPIAHIKERDARGDPPHAQALLYPTRPIPYKGNKPTQSRPYIQSVRPRREESKIFTPNLYVQTSPAPPFCTGSGGRRRSSPLHRPLSIWSGMLVFVHLAHWRHVSATTLGGRMRRTRSSPVTNCMRKPADECQAMWQWKGQTPRGESATISEDGGGEPGRPHLDSLPRQTASPGARSGAAAPRPGAADSAG